MPPRGGPAHLESIAPPARGACGHALPRAMITTSLHVGDSFSCVCTLHKAALCHVSAWCLCPGQPALLMRSMLEPSPWRALWSCKASHPI